MALQIHSDIPCISCIIVSCSSLGYSAHESRSNSTDLVSDEESISTFQSLSNFLRSLWFRSHHKFALGNGTRTIIGETEEPNKMEAVPPNSNVLYKVAVTQKVRDTSRLNPYFTIQKALNRKMIANDIYQNEWCELPVTQNDPDCDFAMRRAIRLYTKAAQEMETLLQGTYFHTVEPNHPQRDQTKQIRLDSLNNIVALRLKQKRYHDAKTAAIEVLKVDPSNTKALLRAAMAAIHDPSSNMEEAKAAIQAAESSIASSSGNKKSKSMQKKELKRLKNALKEKQADYKEKSKEMFGNKLRARHAAISKQKEAKPVSTVPSEMQQQNQQQQINDGPIFGRNDVYTLLMQTVVPLIALLLIKFLLDKSLING